jgi:succinate dehydrogenase/fumarate reductase flavoprotein subunit
MSEDWPEGEDREGWDAYADVVVVGSGAAGCAAALSAAAAGAKVVILERDEYPGGTTAKSGGVLWIPNNPHMGGAGLSDPRDRALAYMARLSYPNRYTPGHETLGLTAAEYELIQAFYDTGPEMIRELEKLGAIDTVINHSIPDYHADLPEDAAPYGRHLQPRDVPPPAEGTGGQALVAGMLMAAEQMGVRLLLGRRVIDVLRNDAGEIVGVEAHHRHSTTLIRAGRGVVFASGGYTHNPELVRQYLRGPIYGGCAAATNTGDFVRLGIKLGADLGNMAHAWWSQTVLELALRVGPSLKDVWMPFGDSMIQVNRYGRRALNEKMIYNERSQAHFEWSASGREYPNLFMFMIYDDAVANAPGEMTSHRQPVPLAGETESYVISGDTWEDLTRNISARLAELGPQIGYYSLAPTFAEELSRTVQAFNAHATAGRDPDFRRGETPIQVTWGGPGRPDAPNPTMHAFSDTGPYHAIILAAGALDTKGGPRINVRAQVLDTDGAPIPGLYGAGNCIASPAGQAYWSAGGTIGPALTFGYIAGRQAAADSFRRI